MAALLSLSRWDKPENNCIEEQAVAAIAASQRNEWIRYEWCNTHWLRQHRHYDDIVADAPYVGMTHRARRNRSKLRYQPLNDFLTIYFAVGRSHRRQRRILFGHNFLRGLKQYQETRACGYTADR